MSDGYWNEFVLRIEGYNGVLAEAIAAGTRGLRQPGALWSVRCPSCAFWHVHLVETGEMSNTLPVPASHRVLPIPERVYDFVPIPDPFHVGMDLDNGYEYPTTS